jgi:hypothetical protein
MSLVSAAVKAEVAEGRHLTTALQRVAAIERQIRLIMVAQPRFGSPPLEVRQLQSQLEIAKNAAVAAERDAASAKRVTKMARATG